MTPERARLVRHSWEKLAPVVPRVAHTFYRRLFELDPGTKTLFQSVDHDAQVEKLTQALSTIVTTLDNPEVLIPELSRLGRRHQQYGVTDRNYEVLGDALLGTLRTALGSGWTPELQDAWVEAYTLISSIMKRAGQRASGATPAIKG
jgi:hemoglobin-like flavoprotein